MGLLESHHAHPFPCHTLGLHQASHAPRLSPHLYHGPTRPGDLSSSPYFLLRAPRAPELTGLQRGPPQLLLPQGLWTTVCWPGMISTVCHHSRFHENATPSKPAAPPSLTSPLALLVAALPSAGRSDRLPPGVLWRITLSQLLAFSSFLICLPHQDIGSIPRPALSLCPLTGIGMQQDRMPSQEKQYHHLSSLSFPSSKVRRAALECTALPSSPGALQVVPHHREQRIVRDPLRHKSQVRRREQLPLHPQRPHTASGCLEAPVQGWPSRNPHLLTSSAYTPHLHVPKGRAPGCTPML